VQNLFLDSNFTQKFIDNPQLHLSIIVTGPIPQGQQGYYQQLISDFSDFLLRRQRKRSYIMISMTG
jgi:hypothetical protein